jgi:lipoate-protein ligase B
MHLRVERKIKVSGESERGKFVLRYHTRIELVVPAVRNSAKVTASQKEGQDGVDVESLTEKFAAMSLEDGKTANHGDLDQGRDFND